VAPEPEVVVRDPVGRRRRPHHQADERLPLQVLPNVGWNRRSQGGRGGRCPPSIRRSRTLLKTRGNGKPGRRSGRLSCCGPCRYPLARARA
jgi:hypothetical protein